MVRVTLLLFHPIIPPRYFLYNSVKNIEFKIYVYIYYEKSNNKYLNYINYLNPNPTLKT